MSSTHANDPELLWRTGDLLRQGHNGHVEKAAPLADGILQKCLQLDPAHVGCHYTIARFYVASNPKFASQAEQHLLKARELVAPNVRPEFERFLAFAYFQQGRKTEALHTLDTYIALRPDDTDAVDFKRAIEEDRVKNHWVP